MEKVPVQQRPMESYIFATNLKILDNDSKDTTTIFKYHFVDDKETSKKLTINNRLKKIEVPVNNIPKTSTNVDQVIVLCVLYILPLLHILSLLSLLVL